MDISDRYRSIFWPILLIGGGIIWLLVNLGLLPGWSWGDVWQLWPIVIIAIGVDLLIARRSALIGALVALTVLALIVVVLLAGGLLGIQSNRVEVITEQFSEPLGVTERAAIELDLSVGPTSVVALDGDELLMEAEITHIGEIDFSVTGTRSKTIRLDEEQVDINFGLFDLVDRSDLEWDIAVTPLIPVSLEIVGGVSEADLDLSELLLESLEVDVGVGDLKLSLPSSDEQYTVNVDGGVGETDVDLSQGANVVLTIKGGVGDVDIDIPSNAEVRVDASLGVGNVRLPASFERLSGSDDSIVGEKGVWQTSGYEDAESRITISFDGGVGDLVIR